MIRTRTDLASAARSSSLTGLPLSTDSIERFATNMGNAIKAAQVHA
jgi:hypothetical protein